MNFIPNNETGNAETFKKPDPKNIGTKIRNIIS
jgi:hypothetical protein